MILLFIIDSSSAILIAGLILVNIICLIFIFIKRTKLFSFPPSFYAIIAGALVGAAINLLTGLVFIQEDADKTIFGRILILAVCIFVTSVAIIYISYYLEKLNIQVSFEVSDTEKSRSNRLEELIDLHRYRLVSSLAISWISFIVGIFQIYYIL